MRAHSTDKKGLMPSPMAAIAQVRWARASPWMSERVSQRCTRRINGGAVMAASSWEGGQPEAGVTVFNLGTQKAWGFQSSQLG